MSETLCARQDQMQKKTKLASLKPNSPAGSHNFEFSAGCSENLAQWARKQPYQPEGNGEGNNNV